MTNQHMLIVGRNEVSRNVYRFPPRAVGCTVESTSTQWHENTVKRIASPVFRNSELLRHTNFVHPETNSPVSAIALAKDEASAHTAWVESPACPLFTWSASSIPAAMRHIHSRRCALVANQSDAARRYVANERESRRVIPLCFVRLILLLLASSPALAIGGVHYEFRYFEGRNGHRVVEANDIAEAPDGAIWIFTWGDGVHRIHNTDDKNDTTKGGLPTDWLRGIEYVGDGTLWTFKQGRTDSICWGAGGEAADKRNVQVPPPRFSSRSVSKRRAGAGCHIVRSHIAVRSKQRGRSS